MNDKPRTDSTKDDALSSVTYADALTELDSILSDLEVDDIDIDALASKVERASRLIAECRNRISAAKVQVEQVVAGLAGNESTAADETDPVDDEESA